MTTQRFRSAERYARRVDQVAALSAIAARRVWRRLQAGGDWDSSWSALWPVAAAVITAGQVSAARAAAAYVPEVLAEQQLSVSRAVQVDPRSFGGWTFTGVPLSVLARRPVIASRVAARVEAVDLARSLQAGEAVMIDLADTQVRDAARQAESVAAVTQPAATGYIRHLSLPSCARCAILAGRFYRWSDGFKRHPRCDCFHVPGDASLSKSAEDFTDAWESGQVTGVTLGQRKALELGADPSRVINASRGTYTGTELGRRVRYTTDSTTKRGHYRDAKKNPRLTPQSIFDLAGDDRRAAIELLRKYKYIV